MFEQLLFLRITTNTKSCAYSVESRRTAGARRGGGRERTKGQRGEMGCVGDREGKKYI